MIPLKMMPAGLNSPTFNTSPPMPGIPPIHTFGKGTVLHRAGSAATSQASPFLDVLQNQAKMTRNLLYTSGALGKAAAAGTADPQAVALSVVNARSAFQQFSALLSAGLQAYQEMMRIAL